MNVKEQLDSYSIREKNLWITFLTDLAVALYYWPRAIQLMVAGEEALRSRLMVGVIVGTVMVAVGVSIALAIFLHTQQKPEPMDERDFMIAARSSLFSSRLLVACVGLVIGVLVISEVPGRYTGSLEFAAPGPLLVAHLLLVSLMIYSMTNNISRLFFYRRGY